MSKQIVIGATMIYVGVVLMIYAPGNPLSSYLIQAGAGMVISGVGTMMAKGALQGTGTATRNPVAPWNVVYGRARIGGTIVYISEFDEHNKYLDLVIVLASHVCESVDALLLDGQRVRIDANGCSFTPTQETIAISSIARSNGIVTVVTASAITDLQTGDFLNIKDVSDISLNGRYAVTVLTSTSFTYPCGGLDTSLSSDGNAETVWPNFKAKVYMEVLLGDHSATFDGMLTGTPYDGDIGNIVSRPDNPWTADHKLLGKTCVMLRMHYNDTIFANGLPSISFRVSGKNDIFDPRDDSYGYSENAALCIADFLANETFGFKAVYATEIPDAELIAAANICDEDVDLANGGTEPRYTCNGSFPLTMKRGEILQNLLTSCGGRLTYVGGQFVIHPAACTEPSLQIPTQDVTSVVLTVWASHTANNEDGLRHGTPSAPTNLSAPYDFANVPTGTTLSSANTTLPPDTNLATFAFAPRLIYSGGTIHVGDPGSGWIPEAWNIYDSFVTVTYADASTAVFRPATSSPDNASFSSGQVEHASRANDSDTLTPTTKAEVERWHFSNFSSPAILTLSNFTGAAGGSSTSPQTSSPSMIASGAALANAAGPFRWRQKAAIRDLYNGVKGTYISPANNWQSSDIPPYAQDTLHGYASGSPLYDEGDANLAADGGDRRWLDIQLPFTISVSTAQRLCKIELLRRRQQGTGTFIFNMALYQVTVLDVIQMTLPILGWNNKLLEVTAHRFKLDRQQIGGAEVTLLGTEIDVQETDCSIYDWDPSEELTAHGFQQSSLPSNVNRLSGITTAVNPQSGTTYTAQQSDRGKLISLGNASPVAVTLPEAGFDDGQFDDLWNANFQNTGAGLVTITPTTSTIDGVSSITLQQGAGVKIYSDGSNYYTERGMFTTTPVSYADNETPSGTSPLGTTYTLAHAPNPTGSLELYVNGVLQIQGTDYTLSSATITFTNAPTSDDILRAWYRY